MKFTDFTRDRLKALREERREYMAMAVEEAVKCGMTQRQANTMAKFAYTKHKARRANVLLDDAN